MESQIVKDMNQLEIDDDDNQHFSTVQEISDNFNVCQQAYIDYDNCETKIPYEQQIKMLKKLEKSIIIHGLFSPNEYFKEIPTENIKYLLIPYYLADAFGRLQTNRKSNLVLSKQYLDEFIKLVDHYGLVSKEHRKKWKTISENADYEPTREDKIAGFKEKKDIENKMKNVEMVKDEEHQRELLQLIIHSKILKAIEDVRMINMEIKLQIHREKIEKEKAIGKIDDQANKNRKPMKVWHIPKPTIENKPFMIQQHKTACSHCDPLYNMKIKEELQSKVFQPGFSQPVMTLEEFAIKEEAKMLEMQKQQKEAEQLKQNEDEDSDKDETSDMKTKKARDWDDWKDEHEKGAGNKMRR